MARRYPKYERSASLDAQIAIPKDLDRADVRESTALMQSIRANAERVQSFAFSKASEIEGRRGEIRGATQAQQTLQQYDKKIPITIEGKAAYNAASKVMTGKLELTAKQEIDRLLVDAETNNYSPTWLRGELQGVAQGYPSDFKLIDPVAAELLQTQLQGYGDQAHSRYADKWLAVEQAQTKADGLALWDNLVREAGNFGRDNYTLDEVKVEIERVKNLTENHGIPPVTVSNKIAAIKLAYRKGDLRQAFEDADDKKGFLARFKEDRIRGKGYAKGFTEDQAQAEVNSMESDIRAIDQAEKAIVTTAVNAQNDIIKELTGDAVAQEKVLGDLQPLVDLDEKIEQLESLGQNALSPETREDAAELAKRFINIKKMGKWIQDNKKMPLSELTEYFSIASAKAREGGVTPQDNANLNILKKLIKNRQNNNNTNQVQGFNNKHVGEIYLRPLDLTSPGNDFKLRKQHIDRYAIEEGIQPLYLSPDEVADFQSIIHRPDIDLDAKSFLITSIVKHFGDQGAKSVFKQLDPKSTEPYVHAGAIGLEVKNFNFLKKVLAGQQFEKDPQFDDSSQKRKRQLDSLNSKWQKMVISELDPANEYKGFETSSGIYQAVKYATIYDLLTKGTADYENIIQEAFGRTPTGGGFYEKVILPPMVTEKRYDEVIDAQDDKKPYITFDVIRETRRHMGLSTELPQDINGTEMNAEQLEDISFVAAFSNYNAFLVNEEGFFIDPAKQRGILGEPPVYALDLEILFDLIEDNNSE
jgi:hypothetical protein